MMQSESLQAISGSGADTRECARTAEKCSSENADSRCSAAGDVRSGAATISDVEKYERPVDEPDFQKGLLGWQMRNAIRGAAEDIRMMRVALMQADVMAAMAESVCGNPKGGREKPSPATIAKDNLRRAIKEYKSCRRS